MSRRGLAGLSVVLLVCSGLVVGCQPMEMAVPNVVGQTQQAAETAITTAGLSVGMVTQAYSDTVAAGNVMSQTPVASTSVPAGTAVAVAFSLGPPPAPGATETVMLTGNVPLEMVWIEPGTFMMGRYSGEQDSNSHENPQHQVTLTQGFWMGKYELTKGQWTAVMGTTPWSGQTHVLNDPESPAVYVSWNDAQAFITALNGLTGKTFRLPTEAEREYAARAGTTTRFYWGDDPSYTVGNDYAWWRYNSRDVDEQYAHVVGLKLPNAWDLYDMSGNVWEWCNNWYGEYSSGSVTNPAGPGSGSDRVYRGGSWYDYGFRCRSAERCGDCYPSSADDSFGFRLAR